MRRIVEKSATFSERNRWLENGLFVPSYPASDFAESLLKRWSNTLSGHIDALERRLSWEGIDLGTACRALTEQPINRKFISPPKWLDTLQRYSQWATSERTIVGRCIKANDPIPFEELLLPFVALASEKLRVTAREAYAHVDTKAHAALERHLLQRLSWLSQRTLGLEFSIFRATRNLPRAQNAVYRGFVQEVLRDGLEELAETYPVLAKLLATATDQWIEAVGEMLNRYWSDRREISEVWANGNSLGTITDCHWGLSDYHNQGRTVCCLCFSSGIKLIYKPKNLEMEVHFNKLLDWINAQDTSLKLLTYRVLSKSDYGWAEFINSCACRTHGQRIRYSKREGMLLFLGYFLDATDLHRDNVVSAGEHPVIIDLETLLHPWVECVENGGGDSPAASSVLRTGLVPLAPNHETITLRSPVIAKVLRWTSINTDDMSMAEEIAPILSLYSLAPNMDALIEGFQELYRLFLLRRDFLLTPASPLMRFSGSRVRFVFRATGDYARLLEASLKPTLLHDGRARSIFLEALNRVASGFKHRPNFWPILQDEQQALEILDIPLFELRSDVRALSLRSGEVIPDYFTEPPQDRMHTRLRLLSLDDMQHQTTLIASAFRQ